MKLVYLLASCLLLSREASFANAFLSLEPRTSTLQKVASIHTLTSPVRQTRNNKSSIFAESSSKNPDDSDSTKDVPSLVFNPAPAAVWVALVALAVATFGLHPTAAADVALFNKFQSDPIFSDAINPIFYLIFNGFYSSALIVPALLFPQNNPDSKVPAWPFLTLSTLLGYFVLGPYLAVRPPSRSKVNARNQVGWITFNVLENKLFAYFILAVILFFVYASNIVEALQTDAAWQGYLDLIQSSNFALVSSVDLFTLNLVAVSLIPQDFSLRCQTDNENDDASLRNKATWIALGAFFVPLLGSAVYLALRPPLPLSEKE